MLQDGAQGATRTEILNALRLSGLRTNDIDHANKRLADELSLMGPYNDVDIENSLWADVSAPLKPAFVLEMQKSYDAHVENLALRTESGIAAINDWTGEQTRGKIPKHIKKLNQADSIVLINTIHFKAPWRYPFEQTHDEPFKLASGQTISHPRMKETDHFGYYKAPSFQLAALPYRTGQTIASTMYVFLPKSSMSGFLGSLSSGNLEKWISKFDGRRGLLELPKFKLENSYSLVDSLKKLGIRRAFSPEAELHGISEFADQVSDVQQDTYIDVNEEGTEAAAATSVKILTLGVETRKPFHMVVDHPFFVIIRDETTKAILFMGVIRDPRGT